MTVEIGKEAIDRPFTWPSDYTVINFQNPATSGGMVTSIDIQPNSDLTGVKIGIFYLISGTTYKCRSSVTLGDVPAGFQNIGGLTLRVAPSDLIGMYWATGSMKRSTTGEDGILHYSVDGCDEGDQVTYTFVANNAISLGGYITDGLIVTIQPMTKRKAHGTVAWLGGTPCTQHGHCWNTTGTPTIADDKTELGAVASAPHPFESTLTGLLPPTLYYVRGYATDTGGTVYSNELSFSAPIIETEINPAITKAAGGGGYRALGPEVEIKPTYFGEGGGGWNVFVETELSPLLPAPEVTTDPALWIGPLSATLDGTLDSGGGIQPCDCGFEWGLTAAYGETTPTEKKETGESFSQAITGLLPNTTYHFRAFATGFGTSYGADRTFTTAAVAILATVTTDPATRRGAIAATINGTLNQDGGEACECGFEWGLDTGYGTTTPPQGKTTGETFSQVIGGLQPGTTYHFRAFATNSVGTSHGADRTFTTALVISRAFALAREEL